jgi:hypothetical protein
VTPFQFETVLSYVARLAPANHRSRPTIFVDIAAAEWLYARTHVPAVGPAPDGDFARLLMASRRRNGSFADIYRFAKR